MPTSTEQRDDPRCAKTPRKGSSSIERLYLFGTDYADQADLFSRVSAHLVERGYVRPAFEQALIERERAFPTGLPTEPAVAIPHTDGTHVERNAIVCILNDRPLEFVEMCGGPEDIVRPRLLFMLVMHEGKAHLEVLQNLIEKIQDRSLVERMVGSTSEGDFKEAVEGAW